MNPDNENNFCFYDLPGEKQEIKSGVRFQHLLCTSNRRNKKIVTFSRGTCVSPYPSMNTPLFIFLRIFRAFKNKHIQISID